MSTESSLRRSWLYVPGDDARKLSKASSVGADVVILDLEDSVAQDRKQAARDMASGALQDLDSSVTERFVRINSTSTPYWQDDVLSILAGGPDGILIPKSSSPKDIRAVADLVEAASVDVESRPELAALVTEDVADVFGMGATITASSSLRTVMWGSEDLSAALGTWSVRDEEGQLLDIFRYVRSLTLLSARNHERAFVDTPFVDFGDLGGLYRESRDVAVMGGQGKQAIHPQQVAVINEAFLPRDEELAAARRLLCMRDETGGVSRFGDSMADGPHALRAKQIVARANAARDRGQSTSP